MPPTGTIVLFHNTNLTYNGYCTTTLTGPITVTILLNGAIKHEDRNKRLTKRILNFNYITLLVTVGFRGKNFYNVTQYYWTCNSNSNRNNNTKATVIFLTLWHQLYLLTLYLELLPNGRCDCNGFIPVNAVIVGLLVRVRHTLKKRHEESVPRSLPSSKKVLCSNPGRLWRVLRFCVTKVA